MRIGIDAYFVTRAPRRGIGTYSLNLIRHLVVNRPEIEFFIYIRFPDIDGVLPHGPNIHVRQIPVLAYPIWEQLVLPILSLIDRLDILHSLGNTSPIINFRKTKIIVTLHDVMFMQKNPLLPKPTNFIQKIGRLYRSLIVQLNTRRAQSVIASSQYSKDDILLNCPYLDEKKIAVIYLSCDKIFAASASCNYPNGAPNKNADNKLDYPFILCLGANDPRKNTLRVVQAYIQLVKEHHISEKLFVVGYDYDYTKGIVYKEALKAGMLSRIRFLPFVTIEQLVLLYQNASVFVYPSLYEGFGLPILEAFNAGCPVIASSVTSIPEVGGAAVVYVDPIDVFSIKEAMLKVTNDHFLRARLSDLGRMRAAEFTWERAAIRTFEVYERAFKGQA